MIRYGCCWLLIWIAHWAGAQPNHPSLLVGTLGEASGEVSLLGSLYHVKDSTGQLSIDEVIRLRGSDQFRPLASRTIRQDFGYNTTAVHWLSFDLETIQRADLMLEIEYASIDEVELFIEQAGAVRSLGRTGDRFLFQQRPFVNNHYVFPIQLPTGDKARYYIRLHQPHAVLSFFVRLWHRPAFLANDRAEYVRWGTFIGVICIMAVLSIVMLLALRDWIYLWYTLYLHLMTMHLFTDAGLSFQYLWPTLPRLNGFWFVYLYVWAAALAQTAFMQYFIHQNRRNSRIFRWVNAFKWSIAVALAAVIMVNSLAVPGREQYMYWVVSLTTSCLVPVTLVLTIISLYERRHEKEPMVRYYGYALAVQFTGYLVVAIMNFCQAQGWPLPFDVETYVVLGLTMLTDMAFFSYGLAYRYTHSRQNNQQLELNLLESRQNAQRQVIDSLQDERRRLAQDLHDDVGATLATAKGYLSVLSRAESSAPLLRSQMLLDEAADELRTLSHQLMPKQFEEIGLAKAIEETIRKVSGGRTQFDFVSVGQVKRLSEQTEMLIFSITTELVRNVQKRAGATEATVQLLYHPDQLNLTVEDNGPPAPTHDGADTGWRNLRIKAEYLKADLLIDANDQGNSVMLSVPIPLS